ncbi:hypothetical protein C1645_791470, partial [Glomus cerebriforme]
DAILEDIKGNNEIKNDLMSDAILEDIKGNNGIKNELTAINKLLSDYVEAIKESPYLIDSDKIPQIVKERIEKKSCEEDFRVNGMVGIVAVIVAVLAAPEAAAVAATAGGFAWLFGTSSIMRKIEAKIKKYKIKNLENQLNLETVELIEKIKLFSNDLNSVILEIGTIETFWILQIERIDYLIKNLEKFNTGKRYKKDQIIETIEKRWKDVERECQIYAHSMRDLLNKDALLSLS